MMDTHNPFYNKKDPLVNSVMGVMKENDTRRQVAEKINAEFGIQSRGVLPHEHQRNYDVVLEKAIQEALHPDKPQNITETVEYKSLKKHQSFFQEAAEPTINGDSGGSPTPDGQKETKRKIKDMDDGNCKDVPGGSYSSKIGEEKKYGIDHKGNKVPRNDLLASQAGINAKRKYGILKKNTKTKPTGKTPVPAKNMKEENLQEVGDTPKGRQVLRHYIKKANGQLSQGTFAAGKENVKNALRKTQNRRKGIERADATLHGDVKGTVFSEIATNLYKQLNEALEQGDEQVNTFFASLTEEQIEIMEKSAYYDSNTGDYEIQKGDTLTSIAKAKGTSIDQLLKLNPQLKDPNKIAAGGRLTTAMKNPNLRPSDNAKPAVPTQAPTPRPAPVSPAPGAPVATKTNNAPTPTPTPRQMVGFPTKPAASTNAPTPRPVTNVGQPANAMNTRMGMKPVTASVGNIPAAPAPAVAPKMVQVPTPVTPGGIAKATNSPAPPPASTPMGAVINRAAKAAVGTGTGTFLGVPIGK